MKQLAARDFEDMLQVKVTLLILVLLTHLELQCSVSVFDGLFEDQYNSQIMDLLMTLSHWHGLAKLRMHSDATLEELDRVTLRLGEALRTFRDKTCPAFQTKELAREKAARTRRQAKKAKKSVRHEHLNP